MTIDVDRPYLVNYGPATFLQLYVENCAEMVVLPRGEVSCRDYTYKRSFELFNFEKRCSCS